MMKRREFITLLGLGGAVVHFFGQPAEV